MFDWLHNSSTNKTKSFTCCSSKPWQGSSRINNDGFFTNALANKAKRCWLVESVNNCCCDLDVKFKKDNRVFEGIIKSVSPSGKLIVHHAIEEEFDFGQVEWLI